MDPDVIMQTSHGRRSIDTLALYDQNKANWDCWSPASGRQIPPFAANPANADDDLIDVSYIEGLIPNDFGQDAQEVPGARRLLADLEAIDAPWGIVTSGTRALMTGRSKIR